MEHFIRNEVCVKRKSKIFTPIYISVWQRFTYERGASQLRHMLLLPGGCGLSPHDVERGTGRPWYTTAVYLSARCSVWTSSSASRCYLCILCVRGQIYRTWVCKIHRNLFVDVGISPSEIWHVCYVFILFSKRSWFYYQLLLSRLDMRQF